MAKALIENGAAKVYILGRRLEKLEEAVKSIGKGSVVPIVCDVTSKDSLTAAAQKVSADSGFLNLLICNSGITGPNTRPYQSMTVEEFADANFEVPIDQFTDTFAVNTTAVWYTTMAFLKLLSAGNKKGNIWQKSQVIATSSIAAFNKTSTAGYAYGQSKAASVAVIKQLSVALPTWDIRANVICPGVYPSDMTAPYMSPTTAIPKKQVPLERMGDELDMGGTVLYLASRAGAYCNGTVILTDGGRLTTFPSTF